MRNQIICLAIACCIISCENNKKTSHFSSYQESSLKSNVLIEANAELPFSKSDQNDRLTLFVSGKNIYQGIATFKVSDEYGNEIYCETFPSKSLIQPEYKTANKVLQEVHIKEVVEGYFVDTHSVKTKEAQKFANL